MAKKLRFEEPEGDDAENDSPKRKAKRKATGFVKKAEAEPDGKLRFAEPEEDEGEQEEQPLAQRRTSIGRKKTGFMGKGAEEDEGKPRFAEPEDDDEDQEEQPLATRRTSIGRKKTGFVAPPTDKVGFEAPAEEGEGMERQRSLRRKPTGFVKPVLDDEDEDDEAAKATAPIEECDEEAAEEPKARPCTPLNEGEEGEEDDPDDEDLQGVMTKSASALGRGNTLLAISKSASAPSLAGSLAVARRRKVASHLSGPRPKGVVGAGSRKLLPPQGDWDERHHLAGVENEMLPKKLRAYFSRPQEFGELKLDLEKRENMTAMIKRMEQEEVPPTKPTPITADSGAPTIPTKHVVTACGSMKDRDNEERPWNNRWSQGIGTLNEGVHPLHRQYFSKDSLFTDAPSQRWRRYADVEVAQGVWKPNLGNKPQRFPPIGAAVPILG